MHRLRILLSAAFLLAGMTALPASASPQTIIPGTVWRDTQGNVIQAHGGGILQVNKTYYWFGEDHTLGSEYKDIPCYVSTDLAHWTFRRDALTRQPDGDLGPHRVVERPKVIYNRRTRTYVMYLHIDNASYREAKVGVATSRNPSGPYTYHGSFQPLGHQSRDMTLYEDSDGSADLIFEDRQRGVCIAALAPDFLSVTKQIALIPLHYEAPAVVKVQGTYFLLGSHLTGWNTNDNQYATAPSLAGPWSSFQDVAPAGTKTYNSQTAFILPVYGTKTTSFIYMGDRWEPHHLGDSRYLWLPLIIDGQTMSLPSDTPWTIDAVTGEIGLPGQ